jgi:hypothetical protein
MVDKGLNAQTGFVFVVRPYDDILHQAEVKGDADGVIGDTSPPLAKGMNHCLPSMVRCKSAQAPPSAKDLVAAHPSHSAHWMDGRRVISDADTIDGFCVAKVASAIQYSWGHRMVVAERSASVMIQIFSPLRVV